MHALQKPDSGSSRTIENSIAAGLCLIIIALVSVFILLNRSRRASLDTQAAVLRTREILLLCADLQSDVAEFESAARAYIITGEENFLHLYYEAASSASARAQKLAVLTRNSDRRQLSLEVGRIIRQRTSLRGQQITEIQDRSASYTREWTGVDAGRSQEGTIRTLLAQLRAQEDLVMKNRKSRNEESIRTTAALTNVLVALILAAMLFASVVTARTLRIRRAAERRARSGEEYFKAVLDNISDAVIAASNDNRLLLCNPAAEKLFGPGASYFFEENIGAVENEYGNDSPLRLLKRAIAGEAGYHPQMLVKNPEIPGGKHISVSARPVVTGDDKSPSAVIVVHDISEQKQAHEQLLLANKELDAFCYSISHDLRAPLRSINGFSRILLEDHGRKIGEEAVRLCDVIIRSGERMGRLIDDLLEFSRISKHQIARSSLNMQGLFTAVSEKLLTAEQRERVSININDLPPAEADPDLIRQVAVNLLSNAFKYSSKKTAPVIEVGSITLDNVVAYYVRDNGVGFDMKYYSKLFEVFQRLHSRSEFEGSGVGLSIVDRIVRRHGGKLWAESVPDEGATFYFTVGDTPPSNSSQ